MTKSKAQEAAEEYSLKEPLPTDDCGYCLEKGFLACAKWLLAECEKRANSFTGIGGITTNAVVDIEEIRELVNGK